MPTITVSRNVAASADAIWALLADFADVRWIPVIDNVTVEGTGPGMRRKIYGSKDPSADPTIETLIWTRPEQKQLSYRITNNPLPVSKFEAVVSVADSAPATGGCRIAWAVDYEPAGDDGSARASIEMVYGMMADWLQTAASSV